MSNYNSAPDFSSILDPISQFFDGFNYFFYIFFQFGNYILFFIFLIMGIILFMSAREREYSERIMGKIEMIKKRGRTGTVVCLLVSIGFLSKGFTILLYHFFTFIPEPEFVVKFLGNEFDSIKSIEDIHSIDLYGKSFFFFISFLSFLSLILLSIGIYLIFFNKFIIRSKLKFLTFIGFGLFFGFLVGFRTSLKLLV